jgi:hypothetical protein
LEIDEESEDGCDNGATTRAATVVQKTSKLRSMGLHLTDEQKKAVAESEFLGGAVVLLKAALAETAEAWRSAKTARAGNAEARARLHGVEQALRCALILQLMENMCVLSAPFLVVLAEAADVLIWNEVTKRLWSRSMCLCCGYEIAIMDPLQWTSLLCRTDSSILL